MAYADITQVSALCRNLLGDALEFGTSTSPTSVDVEGYLSSGCSVIETTLAARGIAIPVAATAPAYGWVSDLNALYAAARAELTRLNVSLGPGERNRGSLFNQMFKDGLQELVAQNLLGTPTGQTTQAPIYMSGTMDKTGATAPMRFQRGQFQNPTAIDNSGYSASSSNATSEE